MILIIIVILFIVTSLILIGSFKLFKWTLKSKRQVQVVLALTVIVLFAGVIHHLFFKKMHFIPSNVYTNLYLIKYPSKDYFVVEQAILKKMKEHLQTSPQSDQIHTPYGQNSVLFYEYGGSTFGFIGEAGTGHFIDHKEDPGGFVSEELGMYPEFRLAEFYFDLCKTDSSLLCGEINYFKEGVFFKADSLSHLIAHEEYIKASKIK